MLRPPPFSVGDRYTLHKNGIVVGQSSLAFVRALLSRRTPSFEHGRATVTCNILRQASLCLGCIRRMFDLRPLCFPLELQVEHTIARNRSPKSFTVELATARLGQRPPW